MTSKQRFFLRAFAVWTIWVWGTRIWNVLADDTRGTAFKVVHLVLALISVLFAIGTWIVTARAARATGEARQPVSSA